MTVTRQRGFASAAVHGVSTFFGLSFVVLTLLLNFVGFILALVHLPSPGAFTILACQGALLLVPLDLRPPRWALTFIQFTFLRAQEYFPMRLVCEDAQALMADKRPLVYGYEPHDVLPLSMFMFLKLAGAFPEPLHRNLRVLASSAVFYAPLLRHYLWWSGVHPVSRQSVVELLSQGISCVVCPGGVKECMHALRDGHTDVAYLTKRTGFIKLAMQHGADVVPVFCFGQRDLYSYLRPFVDVGKGLVPDSVLGAVSSRLGFLPMLVWGAAGTPLPRRVPVTVVAGKPIRLPKVEHPTKAQVHEYLQLYIDELHALHTKYKGQYGSQHLKLKVV